MQSHFLRHVEGSDSKTDPVISFSNNSNTVFLLLFSFAYISFSFLNIQKYPNTPLHLQA
jgi:hypothetical protein